MGRLTLKFTSLLKHKKTPTAAFFLNQKSPSSKIIDKA